MAYIGSSPTKVVSRQSANIFTYQATANQTAFTGADANGNTLACSPSDLMVHMNGIKLEESDYSASTTTVTLVSGAAAGDEVTITAFLTFESADHYTKSAADTRYVNASGDTMSGNLLLSSGSIGVGTTSPLRQLSALSTTGNAEVSLVSGTSNQCSILMGDGTTGTDIYKGYLQYDNNTDGMLIATNATSRINIDSSGNVTMPNQPAFLAVGNAGQTSFTSGAIINIVNEQFDKGNNFNTSNGRFTAPVAGAYCFNYAIFSYDSGKQFTIKKNGNDITPSDTHGIATAHTTNSMTGTSTVLNLAANDYINVGYRSGHSGSVYINHCHFAGFLVG